MEETKAKPEPKEIPVPVKVFDILKMRGNIKEVDGVPRFTTGGECPAFGRFNQKDIAVPIDPPASDVARGFSPAKDVAKEEAPPGADPYADLTRDDLVVECKRLDIDPPDKANKAKLIQIIKDKLKEVKADGE